MGVIRKENKMENFERNDTLFSLCGLNCALCPMYIDKYCPGCGGGPGNQSCAIARCRLQHGDIEYCCQCPDYPCEKYRDIDKYDSFITHKNQLKDMDRLISIGTERYHSELKEKMQILRYLLDNFNDGRRKSFFCMAVNLIEIEDLKSAVKEIEEEVSVKSLTVKEKAAVATEILKSAAARKNIVLKLRKKEK